MAGLVCYYNSHKYHYLFISCSDEKQKYISIMSCEGDPTTFSTFPLHDSKNHISQIKIPANQSIFLRASVNHQDLIFSWSLDNKTWNIIDLILDYSLISDEAGKGAGNSFTGAFVGMCCQDLSGQSNFADFEFFEHIEE
jgi:xylan 1,4-beta-xylosidase